jgi:hypothetical protein
MALPLGTEYVIPITINKNLVMLNNSVFLYEVDLTAYWSLISKYITTGVNVCVYDPYSGTVLPKFISNTGLTDNKVWLYFNGPLSKDTTKTFLVCFGKSINVSNDSSTFTSLGYTNYWSFNEISGDTTYDNTYNYNGTLVAPAYRSIPGFFGNSVINSGTGSGGVTFTNEIIGSGQRTFEMVLKVNAVHTSDTIFNNGKCSLEVSSTSFYFTRNSLYTNAGNNVLNIGNWIYLVIVSTSSGLTNFYINGELSGTANQSAGTPAVGTANLKLLNVTSTPFDGKLDEFGLTSNGLSSDFIKTRYNLKFNQSFMSIGTGYANKELNFSNSVNIGNGIGF